MSNVDSSKRAIFTQLPPLFIKYVVEPERKWQSEDCHCESKPNEDKQQTDLYSSGRL
jgi:hypothetical protein